MVTCSDPDIPEMIGMRLMIPWMLMGTDSATFINSDRLPSPVIIFQLALLHLMFNPLATSSHITQISDRPAMSMGSLCPCIFPRTVAQALVYYSSVYPRWSFRLEKAEMCAIPISYGVC